jgi:S-methylmethionine-dependent homocysteine/selenocysteine methylase
LLVNCLPVAQVSTALLMLREEAGRMAPGISIGAYANAGHVDESGMWSMADGVFPGDYASAAQGWLALGASIVGGCCGTTPGHIHALV